MTAEEFRQFGHELIDFIADYRERASRGEFPVLAQRQPGALRAAVTSPGGTTAAALRVFEQADLAGIVQQALTAARNRSVELGKQGS